MFTILHDLSVKSTAYEVYDAVTLPHHLDQWWTLESAGEPELNEEYRLFFDPQYDWRAQVVKAIPSHTFALKMMVSDEDWAPTYFGFDLEDREGVTQIQFYHRNWQSQNHHFRRTSYCWAILLQGLQNYLEKGIVIPFAERA